MSLLERFTDFMESRRGGVYSAAGWALVVKTRAQLKVYFAQLGLSMPEKPESLEELQAGVEYVITMHSDVLRDILTQGIQQAYHLAGGMSVFNEASTELDDIAKADLDRPPSFEVVQYAITHAAELVKGINDTTRDMLRKVIANGIAEQRGVPGTAADIRKAVADMSGYRAKSIATTEINGAMSQATLDKIKHVGLEYKRWVARTNCCPICAKNKGQGAIPVDQAFSSGVQRPPAHPGKCRCAIVGVRKETLDNGNN